MARVRKLEPGDLPRLTEIFRRVFTDVPVASDEALAGFFRKIYFDHPWRDDRVSPLIYETQTEGIIGFLGVTPRPLIFQGAQILAAVTSTFMVDPGTRGSMAGVALLKAFLGGPQDLAVGEGNDISRKLWLALGGTVSLIHSVTWVCPLRPAAYALSKIGLPRLLGSPVDRLLALSRKGPFQRRESRLHGEEMSVAAFLDGVESFGRGRALRPVYTAEGARWLFDLLQRKRQYGDFQKTLLRMESGKVAGWCLWHHKRKGTARVAQLVCHEETAQEALTYVMNRASELGAVALSGRLEPHLVGHVAGLGALFGRGFHWMLVHSRDSSICRAIQAGEALFTRLEGEGALHFAEV